jgi:hypothetical protein
MLQGIVLLRLMAINSDKNAYKHPYLEQDLNMRPRVSYSEVLSGYQLGQVVE